jgi:opacity protein-like surface antigen
MKNMMWAVLIAVLAGSSVSAESWVKRVFGSLAPGNESSAELPVPGESVGRYTVKELLPRLIDLEGKVVEVRFDKIYAFRQVGKDDYMAVLTFESIELWDGLLVTVPREGRDFFLAETDKAHRSNETLFVQLSGGDTPNRVLGTRIRSSEPKGEQYQW